MVDPCRMSSPSNPSVTVVIPTYNERENLALLIPELLDQNPTYRVVIVDDNSPDGTGKLADKLATDFPGRIFVVHRPKKQGIGPAYVAGFREALCSDSEFIATMDADHSHSPNELPRLVKRGETADLVLGSRYVPGGDTHGWPAHRKLISRLGGTYARIVLGLPIADLTGGFKVYKRRTLEALDLESIRSDGYAFQIETTYDTVKSGFCVVEEPITFTDRYAGKSKLSRMIVLEAMLVVWRLRFARAHVIPSEVEESHSNERPVIEERDSSTGSE
jgi:dolichol-phosphate mannosyltransferase